jgi:MFS family permease
MDMASEMLYPIMPVYLKSIGFSIVLIGVLEGLAEAVAGLSKGYFGKLSDASQKRLPFVQLGYLFSAISKPMLALFTFPIWIFTARTIDRLGKGVRTGARDALLSDATTPEHKAKVFGFHRAFDTLGAVIGPSFALVYLYFNPDSYKTLFIIAFFPGLLSVALTFLIKEKKHESIPTKKVIAGTHFLSFLHYLKSSTKEYKRLVIGLLAFTLFNSSDVFLLLMLKNSGLNDTQLVGVYIFYNLVYAIFSYPMGSLADKIGVKTTFIIGLFLFALVYAGMAVNTNLYGFFGLFLVYGIYAASTESISKAWISNICDKKDTATAIGTYTAFQSVATMLASTLAGLIWVGFGAKYTFLVTAIAAIFVIIYFLMVISAPVHERQINVS